MKQFTILICLMVLNIGLMKAQSNMNILAIDSAISHIDYQILDADKDLSMKVFEKNTITLKKEMYTTNACFSFSWNGDFIFTYGLTKVGNPLDADMAHDPYYWAHNYFAGTYSFDKNGILTITINRSCKVGEKVINMDDENPKKFRYRLMKNEETITLIKE